LHTHRRLPSYPTRRSSDLNDEGLERHDGPGTLRRFGRNRNRGYFSLPVMLRRGYFYPCGYVSKSTGLQKESRKMRGKQSFRLSRSEEHTSELQSPCSLVCR